MLKAMGQARFSVFRVERPHETAGLLVRDLMREEGLWLVDENLERTAPVGLTLAMRVSRPETFAMTCGVMVPTNAVLIDEVLDEVQGRVRGEPGAIANDRRFATALYRRAVMSGIMDQIGFASPGSSPPPPTGKMAKLKLRAFRRGLDRRRGSLRSDSSAI